MILLTDLGTFDLAAQGLGEFIYIFNDTGVFVGGCYMLYMVLQLLGQLRAGSIALCQDDGCLYYLSTDGIRCGSDGAFYNCRMLDQSTFNLKGSDPVAGALDDIIVSANEPVVAVGITPAMSPVL